jgi:hypothetical protein
MINSVVSHPAATELSAFVRNNPAVMILVSLGVICATLIHAYLKAKNAVVPAQGTTPPVPTIHITAATPLEAVSVAVAETMSEKTDPLDKAETISKNMAALDMAEITLAETAPVSIAEVMPTETLPLHCEVEVEDTTDTDKAGEAEILPALPEEEKSLSLPKSEMCGPCSQEEAAALENDKPIDTADVGVSPSFKEEMSLAYPAQETVPEVVEDLGKSWGWIEHDKMSASSFFVVPNPNT